MNRHRNPQPPTFFPNRIEASVVHGDKLARLTQQVAYNSILSERRKQIHEQAAQAIEVLFATNLPDHYMDLAHHYVRSGNAPKAINFLQLVSPHAGQNNHCLHVGLIHDFHYALWRHVILYALRVVDVVVHVDHVVLRPVHAVTSGVQHGLWFEVFEQ